MQNSVFGGFRIIRPSATRRSTAVVEAGGFHSRLDGAFPARMKAYKTLSCFTLLCCIFFASGCATVTSPPRYAVTVGSEPTGATVKIINKYNNIVFDRMTTPGEVKLSPSAGFMVPARYIFRFEKDGYISEEVEVCGDLNPWFLADIPFGMVVLSPALMYVDAASGCMHSLCEHVFVTLSIDHKANTKLAKPLHLVPPRAAESSQPPKEVSVKSSGITPESNSLAKQKCDDIVIQLNKLRALKDAGTLSQQEYVARRKALLEKP